ncbi:MAG: hypothetical protein H0U70_02265 [Tatlockia sp.]|nr:hypothetical protein [Tatlockia sp.]
MLTKIIRNPMLSVKKFSSKQVTAKIDLSNPPNSSYHLPISSFDSNSTYFLEQASSIKPIKESINTLKKNSDPILKDAPYDLPYSGFTFFNSNPKISAPEEKPDSLNTLKI